MAVAYISGSPYSICGGNGCSADIGKINNGTVGSFPVSEGLAFNCGSGRTNKDITVGLRTGRNSGADV